MEPKSADVTKPETATTPPKPKQIPSIGRVVHWHAAPTSPPEAAWVIAVHDDDCVSLTTCNSGGTWTTRHSVVHESVNGAGSFWRWPPFVPSK